jgi:hypothetical protein
MAEPERRTLAIRLEPELHAQLTLVARLAAMSVTDLIRWAIQDKLTAMLADPEIHDRAEDLKSTIEQEAKLQADALSSLFDASQPKAPRTTRRKTSE